MLEKIFELGQGTSGDTAQAMLRFMREIGPLLLLWENVIELLEPHNAENLQFLLDAIEAAGYVCCADSYNAWDYFSSAERRRAFGLCMQVAKSGLTKGKAQAWVNKTSADVKALGNESRRAPQDVLLDQDHWYHKCLLLVACS